MEKAKETNRRKRLGSRVVQIAIYEHLRLEEILQKRMGAKKRSDVNQDEFPGFFFIHSGNSHNMTAVILNQ